MIQDKRLANEFHKTQFPKETPTKKGKGKDKIQNKRRLKATRSEERKLNHRS